ncbi:MAG TPA: cupin domain-containing protein [Chloroflexota bacterium]|nr:cupin domain-containing protein [Chloroflexota bacterium]
MIQDVKDAPGLDSWLAERHMQGHWKHMSRQPEGKPYLWRWEDIHAGLMKATEVVPMSDTPRRTIQLKNPSLGDRMTNTIHISVQCVMPGEVAEAHRHNAAAIRFVVQGVEGAFTVVEGEALPMGSGDLITTPNWTWHDHYNNGDQPVIWLDGLDIRLVSLAKMFQQPFSEAQQPIQRPTGFGWMVNGHVRPPFLKHEHKTPPFRYAWSDTQQTIEALKAAEAEDECDGIYLTYSHPVNGGPTLPTFACDVQALRPRRSLKAHRHSCTTIYHAFRGDGATEIEGERFEWKQGDIFVVPPWNWHRHENTSSGDSILFAMTDRPAMQALEIYREEVEA